MLKITVSKIHAFVFAFFYLRRQSDESKLEGVRGLVQALPDGLRAAAAAATAASASRGSKKDAPFTMPVIQLQLHLGQLHFYGYIMTAKYDR